MPARKRASKRSKAALSGRVASVSVERNGAVIRMDDVPADQAGSILGDLLNAFRLIAQRYPELVVSLDPVGGGTPTEVRDDNDWESNAKRVGFQRERD